MLDKCWIATFRESMENMCVYWLIYRSEFLLSNLYQAKFQVYQQTVKKKNFNIVS